MDGSLLVVVIWLATSIWVGFDARSIGAERGLLPGIANMGPLGWFLSSILLWVVAFPLYLVSRSKIKAAAAGPKRRRGGPITGR